jgi:hypothetical protein
LTAAIHAGTRRGAHPALLALTVALSLSFAPHSAAFAQAKAAPENSPAPTLSPYEQATIDAALRASGDVAEPHPEGKIFEGTDVVALPVFEPRDPLPELVRPLANAFHATSRDFVIEREVLLEPGELYDQALVDQSARNLRALVPLSLVLLVPVRGSAEGRVRLLAITKDVWSLRLNSSWLFENGRLENLTLQPAEENLLGLHQMLLGNFVLDPATMQFGLSYVFPRIGGSRIAATASGNAIINRDTGSAEGSYGNLQVGLPLYSIRQEWAWSASFAWANQIARRFVGGELTDFDPSTGNCEATALAQEQGAFDPSRCQFHAENDVGLLSLTRSFGLDNKRDFTLGFTATRNAYTASAIAALPAAEQQAFLGTLVPLSDTEIGPVAQVHFYSSRFLDLLDFDALGLTENLQRGHDLTLQVTPISRALGSSRTFVDVLAIAIYAVPLGDGVARLSVQSNTELAAGNVPDASLDASLRLESPLLPFGRFLLDARVLNRYRNYLNLKVTLGGDTRLRGYPAAEFSGNDLMVGNLEYRSIPLEILSVQVGGALFTDAGDAFDRFNQLALKSSVGFGLRLVFPQLQRSVLRVDIGFPLTPGYWQGAPDVVFTFGQAIPAIAK